MFKKGFYLSPSKINTFYQCPYKYWAHYIAELRELPTPDAPKMFGDSIHNIIPLYYDKITEESTVSEAMEKIEEACLIDG